MSFPVDLLGHLLPGLAYLLASRFVPPGLVGDLPYRWSVCSSLFSGSCDAGS